MREIEIVIANKEGLHLRVAGAVAKSVMAHESEVRVSCAGCPAVNGCSVLQLLTLGASCGAVVRVAAEGPDEQDVLETVTEILTDGAGI